MMGLQRYKQVKQNLKTQLMNGVLLVLILTQAASADTDQLLMKRSSRPFMAEASIEALRPWETPVEGFFVRSHHNTLPTKIDDSWTISFEGLIKRPRKLTLKALKSRPPVSFHAVLECSGNGRALFEPAVSGIQWGRGAVGNAEWKGIALQDLLNDLGVQSDAKYATFEGYDEPVLPSQAKFVRSIPLTLLRETGAILAFEMNRAPLAVAHGGPVRLVMPDIYGQNWVKWVNKVVFSSEPDQRMFAAKAYRMPIKPVQPGAPWDPAKEGRPIDYLRVQTIFTDPKSDDALDPGTYVLRGKTFSGRGAVVKVEISMDGGKSWQAAHISKRKDHSWQEFDMAIDLIEGQAYEAMARATDAAGQTQPLSQEWNPKGYLYHAVDRVRFKASAVEANRWRDLALVKQHCLTCHSAEIIEQQKLTKEGWVAVVKKMADYGLKLDPQIAEKIASVLASVLASNLASSFASNLVDKDFLQKSLLHREDIVDLAAQPDLLIAPSPHPGASRKGKILFSSHCAACHGADARGLTAPRLMGRSLSKALFYSTVKHGRRMMPAFDSQLSAKDLEDIRVWLATDTQSL